MTPEQKTVFKTIFNGLSQTNRDHIMSYFDKMEMCIVEYEHKKFIACHMGVAESCYIVLGQNEYWSFGEMKS